MPISKRWPLALCIALTTSCLSAQAISGTITLLNKNNGVCGFATPDAGSGATYQYAINSPAYSCFPVGVRSIRFVNLPSAMEIFMSSHPDCRTDTGSGKDYWVRLKTNAVNTGDERFYQFEALQNYSKNQTIYRGLKLIDKKEAPADDMRDATTCIKITASPDIDTPAPLATATMTDRYPTPDSPEHLQPFERACKDNYFIVARYHRGDEQADTRYVCSTVPGYTTKNPQWSREFRESGLDKEEETTIAANDKRYIYFTCPVNTVMTARWHSGDENGNTKYRCASLVSNSGQAVVVEPIAWSAEQKESASDEVCGTNEAMIGRAHKNDENGETRFLCAKLRPLAVKGAQ